MQNLKKNWLVAWKMRSGIWQIFTRGFESLKIGILMESFNPKWNKYELKIHWGLMCHDNEEWCKISSGIWGFLIPGLESLRDFHFNLVLLTKAYIAWAKKVQRSNLHETEQVYKIWRGIDLSFQNWHKEFNKFWREHLKVSKSFTLMGSCWAKYILFDLKKYRRVIFYETEEGYKIFGGINFSFQNWHKEFDKFWPGHSNVSNISTLMGCFWAKYILFVLKK